MRTLRTGCIPRPHGLTLVELLVALAIVLILGAVTLPALARSRRSVDRASCHNNLRQWGLATSIYAMDHDDLLPPDGAPNGISRRSAWYTELPRAIGLAPYHEAGAWRTNATAPLPRSPWICPANSRRSNGNSLFHYSLNRYVNGTGLNRRRIRLGDAKRPEATVWIFDNGGRAAVAGPNNTHPDLHRKGALFLFLDGGARWHPNSNYWDPQRNRGHTNHADLVWSP